MTGKLSITTRIDRYLPNNTLENVFYLSIINSALLVSHGTHLCLGGLSIPVANAIVPNPLSPNLVFIAIMSNPQLQCLGNKAAVSMITMTYEFLPNFTHKIWINPYCGF